MLSSKETDDLRAFAGTMIPASATHGVPGADDGKIFADIVRNVPTEAFEMTTPDGGRALNYSIRRPRGVVGVISP